MPNGFMPNGFFSILPCFAFLFKICCHCLAMRSMNRRFFWGLWRLWCLLRLLRLVNLNCKCSCHVFCLFGHFDRYFKHRVDDRQTCVRKKALKNHRDFECAK